MDMRNGDMYKDYQSAVDAGVPAEHIAEVDVEIVRIKNGPFKGRVYQRHHGGLERRIDLKRNEQEA